MSFFKSDDAKSSKKETPVTKVTKQAPVAQMPIEPRPPTVVESEGPTPEEVAEQVAAEERLEADREHLRKEHGFFISATITTEILQVLHNKDHAKEKKTPFFTPHVHNGDKLTIGDVPDGVPEEWTSEEDVFHP